MILVAAEGLWHLGSLFYHDTQYSQLGWFINLLWCGIPLNKAPRTGPHHVWGIYTPCPFSGHEKNADDKAVGWMILLASVCCCDSLVGKHFFYSVPGIINQNFTDGFLLEFECFTSLCNRHLQRSALFALLCRTWHSCSNPVPLRYEQQTDLKLRCA